MKKPYQLGLAIAIAASVGSIVIKSLVSRYPGIGDFWLLVGGASCLPDSLRDWLRNSPHGMEIMGAALKALLAAMIFSVLHLGLKKMPRAQFPVSLGLTLAVLTAMSLGDVVIG